MTMQITSCCYIAQNVLVDPLMADANKSVVTFQPLRDLFRAPVLSDQFLDDLRGRLANALVAGMAAFVGKALRLLGPVASLAAIAVQLPAHCRRVFSDHSGDLHLHKSCFLPRVNLVSLFPGELRVSHTVPLLCRSRCSFNLKVRGAPILSQLASFTNQVKVALRS